MRFVFFLVIAFSLGGCIGDDIVLDTVEESLRITNPIDTLGEGDTYQFEARYFNNIGEEENLPVIWLSSNKEVIDIDETGLATGLAEGAATITAEVTGTGGKLVSDNISVVVAGDNTTGTSTERHGTIQSTSSYQLEGTCVLRQTPNGLVLEVNNDYRASSALPGLYLYLTNNRNSVANALEIGEVTVFSGAHSYAIPGEVGLNDFNYLLYYCKPFSVKVGDGDFEE